MAWKPSEQRVPNRRKGAACPVICRRGTGRWFSCIDVTVDFDKGNLMGWWGSPSDWREYKREREERIWQRSTDNSYKEFYSIVLLYKGQRDGVVIRGKIEWRRFLKLKKNLMFIYFWERETERHRERETQNLKRAPGSELSAQSLM